MQRVFKTRHFQRWMRKIDLTDKALSAAVIEMSQGLVEVKAAAFVRWLQQTKVTAGFLYLDLPKMPEPTSRIRNWRHFNPWLRTCCN